jgi:hypothetical protein
MSIFAAVRFMLKRIVNILIAASLAFLLMLNGVAHEFVHSFAGHEDTVDQIVHYEHKGLHASFEKQHHHCDFLNLPTPVFLTSSYYIHFYPVLLHQDAFLLGTTTLPSSLRPHTALRGPPSIA